MKVNKIIYFHWNSIETINLVLVPPSLDKNIHILWTSIFQSVPISNIEKMGAILIVVFFFSTHLSFMVWCVVFDSRKFLTWIKKYSLFSVIFGPKFVRTMSLSTDYLSRLNSQMNNDENKENSQDSNKFSMKFKWTTTIAAC